MQNDQAFELVLRTPWNGPWRRFCNPLRLITARTAPEVARAIGEVEEAVRDGSYAAGFVTYEAAAAFGLPARPVAGGLPLVCFGVFAPSSVEPVSRLPFSGEARFGEWQPSIDHYAYLEAVEAIKSHIEAGDTYQINFTFRMTAPFGGDPSAAMRDLYSGQAGPWSAYVDIGDHVICSASPELFFSLVGERLTCRPMKGTWPRGFWPEQDAARGEELRRSKKNRAENVMIVDMVRNDLGRLARTGSVRPASLFDVERYPLQWQMTSTVEAVAIQPGPARLFEAMFPCGSITGAPKHSSMQIIRDLESMPRGIYTGAIGYFSPRGRAHFNVAIRTVVIDRQAGEAEFGVGSGIVWDSVDEDEYDECVLKARMLASAGTSARGVVDSKARRLRPAGLEASYVVGDPPGFRLLETILWRPDAGFVLLEAHLHRLAASAECFGFACDPEEVRELVNDAVEDLRGPSRLRVMLEADGSVLCEAGDLIPLRDPLRVALAREPVDRTSVFLYHKTTNRLVYERARASQPEADAVILWNEAGEITEATESNIVIARGAVKVTPPLECGLLPGLRRAELLASGEIVEGRISMQEFLRADEIWLINSVRGWVRGRM
ncbi:MAG TPA: aminodeoxychorismate synthase component I [Vicinamibacterales bacterium]|nr:aminodeoxychorismate synthase component I [Vicinamibacterales bacterium]